LYGPFILKLTCMAPKWNLLPSMASIRFWHFTLDGVKLRVK
jgi:hypothetical protein